MSNTVKIYNFPVSQPSRCVSWLAKLGNIPHESVHVNILAGEQKTPEFLAKNPAGMVPMIETSCGVCAPESAAIIIYLCNNFGFTEYYPPEEITRLKINSMLFAHPNLARKVTVASMYPCVGVLRSKGPQATLEDYRAAVGSKLDELKEALAKIEKVLEGKKYIAGTEKPTLADLQAICELNQLPLMSNLLPAEVALFGAYPNLKQYTDRMAAVPFHDEFLEPFKAFIQTLPTA